MSGCIANSEAHYRTTGTGKYLKEHNAGIQGIGANFIPEILDTSVIDKVVTVNVQQAYEAGRRMGAEEGYLVGISSGASLYAALELARKEENTGKTIVALLPDTGERYLTTPMYQK